MSPNRGWFENLVDGKGREGHKMAAAERELIALSETLGKQIAETDATDERKLEILTALQTQLGEIAQNHDKGLEVTQWLHMWGTLATAGVGLSGLALSTQDVERVEDILNRLALTGGATAIVAAICTLIVVVHQVKNSHSARTKMAPIREQADDLT